MREESQDHPLINVSTRRRYKQPEIPPGASYDNSRGIWTTGTVPLVDILGDMATKKDDVETGEDVKGE